MNEDKCHPNGANDSPRGALVLGDHTAPPHLPLHQVHEYRHNLTYSRHRPYHQIPVQWERCDFHETTGVAYLIPVSHPHKFTFCLGVPKATQHCASETISFPDCDRARIVSKRAAGNKISFGMGGGATEVQIKLNFSATREDASLGRARNHGCLEFRA